MRGLVSPLVAAGLAALGAALFALLALAARRRAAALAGAAVVTLGSAGLVAGLAPFCATNPCEFLQTTSIFLRPTFVDAWRWVDDHVQHATIAYTGNNVPYPLTGPRLTNHVSYINIDRHASWRLHEYDSAARLRRNA